MIQIPNEMIRASAGTGKTYQLTNRFIKLLLCGLPVERIIALTFTRKAAGEFFEGILTKLAKAASKPTEARKLADEISMPDTKQAAFREALRRLVDTMGQLSLGTIDGFFNRIIAMFSLEFGLGGEFEMMSEFEQQQARLRVLEMLLEEKTARREDRESLIETYRLSTAGKDDRRFVSSFEQHLEDCHELWLRVPDPSRWGDPDRLWPKGNPWPAQVVDRAAMVAEWRELIAGESFGKSVQNGFCAMADHLATWMPGKELLGKAKTLMLRALENLDALDQGTWSFKFGNSKALNTPSEKFSRQLAAILRQCVAEELAARLGRTRGVFGLMGAFEQRYDAQVRRPGKLSFVDLLVLLNAREDRLDLEYRMDGAFDHWLLDEFQDTSRLQWQSIADLIDEVVQHPEGRRGFFCVGDQKQSLYQWRGGDPRLFDRVEEKYSGGIESSSLDESWRSVPDVLEMVNAVFGDSQVLASNTFNPVAGERWNTGWRKHTAAKPLVKTKGHAMYVTVDDVDNRWAVLQHLLEQLQPTEHGLECAILVQKNDTVREVVNFLRGALPNVPVMGESATNPGADNPLGAALLSLFRAAAHPADRFSLGHLALTPFSNHLPEDHHERQNTLRQLQRELHQTGFEVTARNWIGKIENTLNDFSRWRAAQFLELARQFDETGSREIDAFLRFMPAQESTDASGANVVQVMTIHKAKGLTFDVTLVPDLENKKARLDSARQDALHTHAGPDGSAEWILDLPPKELCQLIKPLDAASDLARAEACYENLCKLYVAFTRSRGGLYVITSEPSGNSGYYPRLLVDTLAEGEGKDCAGCPVPAKVRFESGNFKWLNSWKAEPKTEVAEKAFEPESAERRHRRLARRRPSSHGGTEFGGASLFEPKGADAAAFGTAVHAIFEQIEWADKNTSAILKAHEESNPAAAAEVDRCLQNAEVAALFEPIAGADVWRERPFELVIDDEFCSGVFDRVHLGGNSAVIIDFKTDRVDADTISEAIKRHQPQLALYRRVLARLTEIPETAITCQLVFTRPTKVMTA